MDIFYLMVNFRFLSAAKIVKHPRYDPNNFDFDIALFKNSFNFYFAFTNIFCSASSAHESCDMISFDHAYLQLIETLKTFKTSDNQLVRENCATT